jgi:ornithine cyclodeaminase/alanine dehydrogenase-like protein (mu-crystallin family)
MQVLDMTVTLTALERAFIGMANGDAAGMGRIDLYVPSGETESPYYRWAVMAGGSKTDGYVCARMLSDMVQWPREHGKVRENKHAKKAGTFCGLLFLFNVQDGTPVAMINDGFLQHMRVGGGAGLGAKYLARPDARVVGMLGSGGMARTYLDAFLRVRPIRKVNVYSPNAENLTRFVDEMQVRHGIDVIPCQSAREAVSGADIVSVCTSSNEPVFFNEWLEPGMHVTNLTSADVEPALARVADVAVRAGEATPKLARTGDSTFYARAGFLSYVAGNPQERALVPKLTLPSEMIDMPTLTDLVAGKAKGRKGPKQTSFFLNVGAIGAQFEAVAAQVYERARDKGLGHEIPADWFLQDVRD